MRNMPVCSWCLLVMLAFAVASVQAQTYPIKPIRFIVPYVPGGGADAVARLIAPRVSEKLGQQVIVDNRGGGGSNIGTELAARTPPDGYTLLMGTAATAINVSLYSKLAFDPLKDFTAVTLLGKTPNVIAIHPSLPAKSIKELIALAKAASGQINYGSGGSGTTPHLTMELFKVMAKVNLVHVPYKSVGPAVIALLSGEVSIVATSPLVLMPHIQSGRLRVLAITSLSRSPAYPAIPTIAESGLPGYEVAQWFGVLAPTGTPDAIVAKLNSEFVRVMRMPEINEALSREASLPLGSTAQDFTVYFREEVAKWAKVVKFAGARVE
jgi:tripartite-type tricarboxylate transporter receptor subunit TctC